jgi:hypothetical protein
MKIFYAIIGVLLFTAPSHAENLLTHPFLQQDKCSFDNSTLFEQRGYIDFVFNTTGVIPAYDYIEDGWRQIGTLSSGTPPLGDVLEFSPKALEYSRQPEYAIFPIRGYDANKTIFCGKKGDYYRIGYGLWLSANDLSKLQASIVPLRRYIFSRATEFRIVNTPLNLLDGPGPDFESAGRLELGSNIVLRGCQGLYCMLSFQNEKWIKFFDERGLIDLEPIGIYGSMGLSD